MSDPMTDPQAIAARLSEGERLRLLMGRDGKTARHPDSRFLDWRPYEAYAHTDIIAYKPEATHD